MLQPVSIAPMAPERFRQVLSGPQVELFDSVIARAAGDLAGRVVWSVSSTANGGGVAEMLRSLIAYARGAQVDARWVVIEGNQDFFRVTKRIHNRLHGAVGDGGPLGSEERDIYEAVAHANSGELAALISPGDIVLLHDPQTAGLAQPLIDAGAFVIWRCHVGIDSPDELSRSAWTFLRPYVELADAYVFSREAFEWEGLDPARMVVIPPSIDAFSAKNQELAPDAVEAILRAAGIVDGSPEAPALFARSDGTPARVDRRARMWEADPIPAHLCSRREKTTASTPSR